MVSDGLHNAPPPRGDDWQWPNFAPTELACRCARYCRGEYWHAPRFLDALEALRAAVGRPLVITSGRRCALHNAAVGGAPLSQHKTALAVDVSLHGHDRFKLYGLAKEAGFTGIGKAASFLHLDRRSRPAEWFYGAASKNIWEPL